VEGDDHGEAYTAIEWGMGLSLEILTSQGPRLSPLREGNMCGTAMRGADALPGSEAISRSKGARRNLPWTWRQKRSSGYGASGTNRSLRRSSGSGRRDPERPAPLIHLHHVHRQPAEDLRCFREPTFLGGGVGRGLGMQAAANSPDVGGADDKRAFQYLCDALQSPSKFPASSRNFASV
jgi:hypothetical protein